MSYLIRTAEASHIEPIQNLEDSMWKRQEGGQAYGQHGHGGYRKLFHAYPAGILAVEHDTGLLLGFVAVERVNWRELLDMGFPPYDHDPSAYVDNEGDVLYMINLNVSPAVKEFSIKGMSRQLLISLIENAQRYGTRHIRTIWHEHHPFLRDPGRFWGASGFVHEEKYDTEDWAPVDGLPGRHTEIWGLKV